MKMCAGGRRSSALEEGAAGGGQAPLPEVRVGGAGQNPKRAFLDGGASDLAEAVARCVAGRKRETEEAESAEGNSRGKAARSLSGRECAFSKGVRGSWPGGLFGSRGCVDLAARREVGGACEGAEVVGATAVVCAGRMVERT